MASLRSMKTIHGQYERLGECLNGFIVILLLANHFKLETFPHRPLKNALASEGHNHNVARTVSSHPYLAANHGICKRNLSHSQYDVIELCELLLSLWSSQHPKVAQQDRKRLPELSSGRIGKNLPQEIVDSIE